MKNTRITYFYRDANNYKESCEVVIGDQVTFQQIAPFLDEGEYFTPTLIGLPHPGEKLTGKFPTEDDHPSCTITKASFEETDDEPTLDDFWDELDVKEFLILFKLGAKLGWEDSNFQNR